MFKDVLFALPGIALTVMCWGTYGSVLHKGQDKFKVESMAASDAGKPDLLAIRLKPLICVGAAYFIVAIVVPSALLISRGAVGGGWGASSVGWSLVAGTAGALGALGIILALSAGGKPIYVMPLVFGCAPIVNVFVSMYFSGTSFRDQPIFRLSMFTAGTALVSLGAVMVLIFQPKKPDAEHGKAPHPKAVVESDAAAKHISAEADPNGDHGAANTSD